MTRDRAQDRKLQVQKALIDWRRSQVIQLVQEGKTLNQIAEILKVDRSTVSRDYQFTRDNSADVMSKYSVETIPMEVMKFLSRLMHYQMKHGGWLNGRTKKATIGQSSKRCIWLKGQLCRL